MPRTSSKPEVLIVRDQRVIEGTMADAKPFVATHEFVSLEEANEALNRALDQGQLERAAPTTPPERAQEIMYKAFAAKGRQRVSLAQRALTIHEDCADAYVLLAEEDAENLGQACLLFLKAVEAAKRTLPKEYFTSKQFVGHFWAMLETRPYMRARAGLADVLWLYGERDAAIGHLQDMLRLNPTDNQGVRDSLLGWLLASGRDKEAVALLEVYREDDSAVHMYGLAYLAFKQNRRSERTATAVRDAFLANRYLPLVFIADEAPQVPEHYCYGDRDEADYAAVILMEAFAALPAFLDWMFAFLEHALNEVHPVGKPRPVTNVF